MKKYLLGFLAIPFGFIAFSSAVSISCEDGNCTSSFNAGPGICDMENGGNIIAEFNGNVSCGGGGSSCSISYEGENGEMYYIAFSNGQIDSNGSWCDIYNYENINFTLMDNSGISSLNGLTLGTTNGGGDDNTGGDSGESGELIGQLTPVVDGLKNSIDEFIPYVVYIGLGVLGVIIGFVAIKWLMNYVKGKSLGTFNSRRRK